MSIGIKPFLIKNFETAWSTHWVNKNFLWVWQCKLMFLVLAKWGRPNQKYCLELQIKQIYRDRCKKNFLVKNFKAVKLSFERCCQQWVTQLNHSHAVRFLVLHLCREAIWSSNIICQFLRTFPISDQITMQWNKYIFNRYICIYMQVYIHTWRVLFIWVH